MTDFSRLDFRVPPTARHSASSGFSRRQPPTCGWKAVAPFPGPRTELASGSGVATCLKVDHALFDRGQLRSPWNLLVSCAVVLSFCSRRVAWALFATTAVLLYCGHSLAQGGDDRAPMGAAQATNAQADADRGAEAERARARQTYDFDPDEPCPFCVLTPTFPTGPYGLHWHEHWNRVGLREFILTPALAASALAIRFVPDAEKPSWRGGILFDDWARDTLTFKSNEGRKRASFVSDLLFYASAVYPVVIDNIIITWFGKQRPDVAWQMFVINAQSYALTFAVNTGVKRLTSRERPYENACSQDPNADYPCETAGTFRSFYSGHAAHTATGAGLLCAHHTQLQLYRSPAADTATCLSGVAATLATGVLRISSDYHWASDVLVGYLAGYASGYLVPTLLYYKEFRISPEPIDEHQPPPAEKPQMARMAVIPMGTPTSIQLSVVGMF